jgi:L-asparaginase II
LRGEHLALASSSHSAAAIHTDLVAAWLRDLGLGDDAFRCGPALPMDAAARKSLICSDTKPCQIHNECSGKHAGFLTLSKHLGSGDADYELIDHPVQKAVKEAFEDVTRAMSFYARAHTRNDARSKAAARLTKAMAQHPEFVAGEGRNCTGLMRAMDHKIAAKTGADGVFVAIIPEKRLGVAVKVMDGSVPATACVIAAVLVKLGVLDPNHPEAVARLNPAIKNRRDLVTGYIRPTAALVDTSYKLRSV